jgi:small-conductance mechanosensitive channel
MQELNFEWFLFLSLFGITLLFWLIANRWINKRLISFLKKRDLLVIGREKNIIKLAKQILLILCCILLVFFETLLSDAFSINTIKNFELIPSSWFGSSEDGSTSNFQLTIGSLFYLIFIVIISRILITMMRIVLQRIAKTKSWIDEGGRYTIVQLSKYFIYTIAFVIAIQGLGINITFLIAGSAALFVGIGFGLQSILGDVFSGVILLFDGSIKVGDVVEMPSEEICKVEHIFIRTSQLKTLDGKIIIVPNSNLTKDNVINWSISEKVTRFHVSVGVAYGSDTQKVKDILYQCSLKHPHVEKRRDITVILEDFGDYSLQFKVFFWARKTWEILNIKSDIRFAIDQAFRQNNIKIPYPQRDLHIVSDMSKDNFKKDV